MPSRLFDELARTDATPKSNREPAFTFLNRSARPEYGWIRALLETWFERVPSPAQADLRGRFRSPLDRAHDGAFFEIFLHELLIKLGLTAHVGPTMAPGHPDFLAVASENRVYVEATDVNPAGSLHAPRPLEDAVLDAINSLPSPNFYLSVTTNGELSRAPAHRDVVQPFANLMAAHDPDDVDRLIRDLGHEAAPSVEVVHGDWRLRGSLLPKSRARRGASADRTIGIGPTRAGFVDSSSPVRKAVLEKAHRYRQLDAPLVVAVNAHDLRDQIDEMEALFGEESFEYRSDRLHEPPTLKRQPNGVWFDGAPRYTQLEGVLVFRSVAPWNLRGAYSCLYLNPYVEVSLPAPLLELPRAVASGDTMQWLGGADIGDLLGVPEDWRNTAALGEE